MPKIIEWYIGRDRKMKNNFRNCLIFRENKLFSTNFRKHNNTLYYNYKIIIYSQALHEFATIYIRRSNPTVKLKEVGRCVSPYK